MNRFFTKKIGEKLYIEDKEDIKHLTKSLRMKEGEKVEAVDEYGIEYIAYISSIKDKSISLDILEKVSVKREMEVKVQIYQGLPKSTKMDTVVQMATELGAYSITPVLFKRCVKDSISKSYYQRLTKIIKESSMQCKRNIIPKLGETMTFDQLLDTLKYNSENIFLYEEEKDVTVKEVLESIGKPKTIGVIIGPEGGISKEEGEELIKEGGKVCTLGNRILRTQTVASSILSMINYALEL